MADPAPPLSSRLALPGRKVLALVLVAVCLVTDLWTKGHMQALLRMTPDDMHASDVIVLVPGFFQWQGNWNPGITFGVLPGRTDEILVFTALACVGLLLAILLLRSRSTLLHVALAMILGGAIGNLYDRSKWHAVRDFIVVYYWPGKQWPAFNAADSFIVVGVGLILWRELFGRRSARPAAPPPA